MITPVAGFFSAIIVSGGRFRFFSAPNSGVLCGSAVNLTAKETHRIAAVRAETSRTAGETFGTLRLEVRSLGVCEGRGQRLSQLSAGAWGLERQRNDSAH